MYNWDIKLECEMVYRRKNMRYVSAASGMVDGIYNVLYTAIKTIYPQYYLKEVVCFFANTIAKNIF